MCSDQKEGNFERRGRIRQYSTKTVHVVMLYTKWDAFSNEGGVRKLKKVDRTGGKKKKNRGVLNNQEPTKEKASGCGRGGTYGPEGRRKQIREKKITI